MSTLEFMYPWLFIIGTVLLCLAYHHNRRHDHVVHCQGIDMTGYKEDWSYKQKVSWITTRPGFDPLRHKAWDVISRWEQRAKKLDSLKD